jgi:hypothetical protein
MSSPTMCWCGFLLSKLDDMLIGPKSVEGFDPLGKIISIQGAKQMLQELLVVIVHQIMALPDKTDMDD